MKNKVVELRKIQPAQVDKEIEDLLIANEEPLHHGKIASMLGLELKDVVEACERLRADEVIVWVNGRYSY